MLSSRSCIAGRPGILPPPVQMLSDQVAFKNAIELQDENAVRQQLANPYLSPDTLQDLLAHAFQQKSSQAIKEALLRYPACLLQLALELAVRYNDSSIARQALQRGADPEQTTACPGTNDMRALLTYARRKNKLYPPAASRSPETDLDRALRDSLDDEAREEARNLLRQAMHGKDMQEAWRDAVKDKQLDVQRAILLLEADKNRGFRLKQGGAVTDRGVAAVMKEIPYFSPKRGLPKNFNHKVKFPGMDEKILCRHLVEHRQAVQERHPQIKFDDAQYASAEAIAANISYDTHAQYRRLKTHAAEVRLFYNHNFGKTLVQQFTAMKAEKEVTQKEVTRLILLTSTNHAMSVGLKIKEKDGKLHYVVEFFDPNRTTSHVCLTTDNLRTFETLTLESFIPTVDLYKDYYPEANGLSVMFVRPSPPQDQAITYSAQGAVENRTLTSCIEDKEINATVLWYMMESGFGGDLKRLKNEIARRPEQERIRLLTAKNARNIPGLYTALQFGCVDTIKAFGELLLLVPPEKRAALLAAKDGRNIPGLSMALQEGHADTIKAFGELLSLVPRKERAELLAAKDAKGFPGLYLALQNGHTDAIKAFGELLLLVPTEERAGLLAAKGANGVSGFAVPLYKGNLEALEQYIEIVRKTAPALSTQERAALLKDIRSSHAMHRLGWLWLNHRHYKALKKKNPDFYLRFKEMKKALKPYEVTRPSLNVALNWIVRLAQRSSKRIHSS